MPGPRVAAVQHGEPDVPGVPNTSGRSAAIVNSGVRCPGRELGDDGVLLGRQVRHAVALDVADDRAAARAACSAGRRRPRSASAASADASSPSARRIRVWSSLDQVRRDRRTAWSRCGTAGSSATAGSSSARPPARTAHRSTRTSVISRPALVPVPDAWRRPRTSRRSPGVGPAAGSSSSQPSVDPSHPVHERHLIDAVVDALQRLPIGQLDGRVDRPLGRRHLSRPDRTVRRTRGPIPPRTSAPWRLW